MSVNEAICVLQNQIGELGIHVLRRTEQIGIHQNHIKHLETNLSIRETQGIRTGQIMYYNVNNNQNIYKADMMQLVTTTGLWGMRFGPCHHMKCPVTADGKTGCGALKTWAFMPGERMLESQLARAHKIVRCGHLDATWRMQRELVTRQTQGSKGLEKQRYDKKN